MPYAPARVRDELLARLTTTVRQLAGTPRWFGLCAQIDGGEVVARMVDGVDLDRRPAWAEVADASLDLLDGVEMYRRTHWLAVPLSPPSGKAELQAAVTAGWSDIADRLGMKPAPVTGADVEAYRRHADQVQAQLAGGCGCARPPRPRSCGWSSTHSSGGGGAAAVPGRAVRYRCRSPAGRTAALSSYRGLGQVRLAEGGHHTTDALQEREPGPVRPGPARAGGVWWKRPGGVSPLRRQWIEVETEHGTAYQAHLVVAEQPAAVVWPQSAWLAQLDQFPFGVDFVVDLHIVPAEKAKPQVRRKKRELVDQADQYGAETSGLPDTLHEAASDLGELGVRLGRTASEVEVQSVTALTVWGRPRPSARSGPAPCKARCRG
ncbi:hypothetical protein ACFQZC_38410 [Streptacidiphilus monticola]